MELLKNIIVVILLLNAIFWSLFSHSDHCKVASMFGIKNCPDHWVHISIGIIFFIIAILIKQYKYLIN